MSWKELAYNLAMENAHELWCPFKGCQCGAVERREEWRSWIMRKYYDESREE